MITAVYSDVGAVRKVNEDSYYISDFKDNNGFIIVADGMGGHKGGKTASKTAISVISDLIKTDDMLAFTEKEIEAVLKECISKANKIVLNKSLCDESLSGMGTTVVICVIIDNKAYIANVGDSRLYAIRKNKIAQITKDHSVVQQLIDMGEITKTEAAHHPSKNLITRAVGSDLDIDVDTHCYSAKPGDYIVLCTDGLTNMVDDSTILECITKSDDLQSAVNTLGDMANKNGGYDNITVVAVKFD